MLDSHSNATVMPRAFVAGAAGFLGSHLTDRLLNEGWEVIGADNLMCGSLSNLERASERPHFSFLQADVISPLEDGIDCDLVLNLACPASPPRYQKDPLHTLMTCVVGTFNLADLAHRSSARIIHSSTSEIYGDPTMHPQPESYRGNVNPIGPRACYDEGKRAAEALLFDMHRTRGLDIGVCRIFNTYGPRMDPFDGRVVSNFIRQMLMNEPVTVYGDGSQTRSFCYVDDMVEGIWQFCKAGPDVTGPINLGNPVEMTILELVEMIFEIVGRVPEIAFHPLPQDDPTRRRPDIAQAKEKLGWQPAISPREGISRTIDYFDELLSSGRFDVFVPRYGPRYQPAAE
ncbi:UDP-glucuronic acid decarboxylase family protein [Tropicimonas aquimaris]|uniref:UDP-glucuronic acid decarboxylase family protein n=1 Tax=Tropicimonas aquimaris TaxID=914152 RepID=A0ABW3ISE0_9RHOB